MPSNCKTSGLNSSHANNTMSSSDQLLDPTTATLRSLYDLLPHGTFVRYEAERLLLWAMRQVLSDFVEGRGNEMARLDHLEGRLAAPSALRLKEKLVDLHRNGSKVERAFAQEKSLGYFHVVEKGLRNDFISLSNKLNTPLSRQEIEENDLTIRELLRFEPDIEQFCEKSCYIEEVEVRIFANYLMVVEKGDYESEEWYSSTDFMAVTFHIRQQHEYASAKPDEGLRCKKMMLSRLTGDTHVTSVMAKGAMLEAIHLWENVVCESNYMIRKRCLAHIPMYSSLSGPQDSIVPVSAALQDSVIEAICLPRELNMNGYEVWATVYMNDYGALDLGEDVARPFKPSEIFLTNPGRIRVLIEELGANTIEAYDETACRIIAMVAAPYYDEESETTVHKYFGAVALKASSELESDNARVPETGTATFMTMRLLWSGSKTEIEEIGESNRDPELFERIRALEQKIVARWGDVLDIMHEKIKDRPALEQTVESVMKSFLGEEKPFREEVVAYSTHYNNPLMFRTLRREVNVGEFRAGKALGGTLTDVKDGENFIVSKTGRKINVVRDGDQLRLLRRGVPKILYYLSRLEISAMREVVLKTEARELIVNPHIGTSTILEMMLAQRDRPEAVKYALRFIEDACVTCSMTSACFLKRGEEGTMNISAVLTGKALSSADCYVDTERGRVFIMIGTRMMMLKRIRRQVYHAESCAVDYSLRRARIRFGKILVGVCGSEIMNSTV